MVGHPFVLNGAGWLDTTPLPAPTMKRLARDYPDVEPGTIQRALEWYKFWREAVRKQPSASEIRGQVEDFREAVDHAYALGGAIRQTNVGAIIDQTAGVRGHADALDDALRALMVLRALLPHSLNNLPAGKAVSPRQVLTADVAAELGRVGLDVSAKPTGPLVQIVGLVLRAAGEDPKNVVEIVKPVLTAARNG